MVEPGCGSEPANAPELLFKFQEAAVDSDAAHQLRTGVRERTCQCLRVLSESSGSFMRGVKGIREWRSIDLKAYDRGGVQTDMPMVSPSSLFLPS